MASNSPGFLGASAEAMLRLYARIAPSDTGMFRVVKQVRQWMPRDAWKRQFQIPGGLKFDLDLAHFPDCCMAYGLFERETERVLQRILKPGDHFVDGGANIGYFTLKAARLVGPSGRIDAFEPQPDNRARLLNHIAINGLGQNITVHDVALSDRAGEATIHYYTAETDNLNHGCSTLIPEAGAATKATTVRTVRMDEVLRGAKPKLVKLDIEGAEPMAVAGMTELLRAANPPAVIMEWGGHAPLPQFGPRGAVEELLKQVPDYQVYVADARWKRIDPTEHVLSALGHVNLLLMK